jgi:hypothetical protein
MRASLVAALTLSLLGACQQQKKQPDAELYGRVADLDNRVRELEAGDRERRLKDTRAAIDEFTNAATAPQQSEQQYELVGSTHFLGSNRRVYPSLRRCEDAKEALIGPIRQERERELEKQGTKNGTYYVPRVTCVPT